MSKLQGWQKIAILFIVLLLPSLIYFYMTTGTHHFKRLPIIGNKELSASGDTIYHTVPDFHLTNQNGKTISMEDYKDRIMVADFFFTTCPSICPKMSSSMQLIQDKFKAERQLRLASFSVDPEHDSVSVLNDYAKKYMVNSMKWNLLTGNKKDIYELGVNGFLLPVQEDVLAPGGFLHSEMLVLVDKEKRIRGFYDGTNPAVVDTLMDEVIVLLQEYKK